MPWKPGDARKKTRKANTPKKQRQWAHVAESARKRGMSEDAAIRMASGVVKKNRGRKRRSSRS
jgi:hypothetical protein